MACARRYRGRQPHKDRSLGLLETAELFAELDDRQRNERRLVYWCVYPPRDLDITALGVINRWSDYHEVRQRYQT